MLEKQCPINDKRKNIGKPKFAQPGGNRAHTQQRAPHSPNHNSELLLTQILCRRLTSGPGIVRAKVGSSYDPLRFIPRSYDLSPPYSRALCWVSRARRAQGEGRAGGGRERGSALAAAAAAAAERGRGECERGVGRESC